MSGARCQGLDANIERGFRGGTDGAFLARHSPTPSMRADGPGVDDGDGDETAKDMRLVCNASVIATIAIM